MDPKKIIEFLESFSEYGSLPSWAAAAIFLLIVTYPKLLKPIAAYVFSKLKKLRAEHQKMLDEHREILRNHKEDLKEINKRVGEQSKILERHGNTLKNTNSIVDGHSIRLSLNELEARHAKETVDLLRDEMKQNHKESVSLWKEMIEALKRG